MIQSTKDDDFTLIDSTLIAIAHRRIDEMVNEAKECDLYGSVSICIKFTNGMVQSVERVVKGNEK